MQTDGPFLGPKTATPPFSQFIGTQFSQSNLGPSSKCQSKRVAYNRKKPSIFFFTFSFSSIGGMLKSVPPTLESLFNYWFILPSVHPLLSPIGCCERRSRPRARAEGGFLPASRRGRDDKKPTFFIGPPARLSSLSPGVD